MLIRDRACAWLALSAVARRLPKARNAGIALVSGAVLLGSVASAGGQVVAPRPLGRDLSVYLPDPEKSGQSDARALENPTGRINLRDALALALRQSPELATFAWEMRAREAAILQAGRPPNPVVTTTLQDLGGSTGLSGVADPIQTQATIELSQVIELGGKRAARQQVAASNRDLVAWDYEASRLDVLTRATRAFLDVLASQETVVLNERATKVIEEVRQAVGQRVAAGVVSPIEETRASVALANVRIELSRARRQLEADRTRLAALWGARVARFQAVTGEFRTPPAIPTFEQLQDRLSQTPELARWAAEIAGREAAVAAARSRGMPDVTIVGGLRRYPEIGTSAYVMGASVTLPLFDRNRAGIQEARDRVSKAFEDQRTAESRVTTHLAEAYRALATARDEVTALEADVVPGAQSAFDAVSEGYRLGRFGYLDVLDAQRTLVGAGGQYLRALADYHKAVAELERLIGVPLGSIAPSDPSPGKE